MPSAAGNEWTQQMKARSLARAITIGLLVAVATIGIGAAQASAYWDCHVSTCSD
jgi:hypothetical protein